MLTDFRQWVESAHAVHIELETIAKELAGAGRLSSTVKVAIGQILDIAASRMSPEELKIAQSMLTNSPRGIQVMVAAGVRPTLAY